MIARVLAGDPAAERELYDAHVDRVYRLAFRMTGDDALAQECTQDTFIRAFDRLAFVAESPNVRMTGSPTSTLWLWYWGIDDQFETCDDIVVRMDSIPLERAP